MPRKHRSPYQRHVLSIEETALCRTVPPELRKCFHRLLDSAWREGKSAAEKPRAQLLIDKLRPQLDTLLDRLYAKPRCQLPLVFDACYAAAATAMVEDGREDAREEGRFRMDRQKKLRERLNKAHREFQRVLAQPTFSAHPDRVKLAQQRSVAFVNTLSVLSLTISPSKRPGKGRPLKTQWRKLSDMALKLAGCPYRDKTLLRKWFRF
jgi:hypothetical protein